MSPTSKNLPRVTVFTDGACDPNPGPGGWAAILKTSGKQRELSGGEPNTTNNRMELRATIEALNALKRPCAVVLYTDSEYLRLGITSRLARWRANGWRTSAKRPVANQDLWQALIDAMAPHAIKWQWVRGHAGNRDNERADSLARAAIPRADFAIEDPGAVHLYAGASCRSATGPGGWAAVLCANGRQTEFSGFELDTTANRMQIRAVAEGLAQVPPGTRVHVHTSSDFVHRGATKWLGRWQRKGWRTKAGQPVKHVELWKALAAEVDRHNVRWHRHTRTNSTPEAARARELAAAAAHASTG